MPLRLNLDHALCLLHGLFHQSLLSRAHQGRARVTHLTGILKGV
jgi:hypothetical protein